MSTDPAASYELLTGWGGTAATGAYVRRPEVETDLVMANGRGVIAHGLGRSYGDAAQNAGGVVYDMTGVAGIRSFDVESGVVRVGAGTSLETILAATVPRGWFPAVIPGTRHVTVGGAIAADIHGKNHHVDGGFCEHVRSFTLRLPSGEQSTIAPESEPETFWATAGGMGLTGIITDAELQLVPIETSLLAVDTERAADLDDVMDRMASGDHRYRYSVAWIDVLASGGTLGRSVLTRANHAPRSALSLGSSPLAYKAGALASVPPWVPAGLLNQASVKLFNEMWFRKAPKHRADELQKIPQYFHPLDAVGNWNRMYGREGFLQYQFVLPDGAEDRLRTIVAALSRAGCPSFLAVLKRFGPQRGYLSFPMPGWTLALDVPAGMGSLASLLGRLDQIVIDAGGRVYLAKDSRLDPGAFRAMHPRLDEWQEIRARLDPDTIMQSDLARRLRMVS